MRHPDAYRRSNPAHHREQQGKAYHREQDGCKASAPPLLPCRYRQPERTSAVGRRTVVGIRQQHRADMQNNQRGNELQDGIRQCGDVLQGKMQVEE